MDISIELNIADAQVAGGRDNEKISIILGSEEVGISLCGTAEQLKETFQEMMSVLETLKD